MSGNGPTPRRERDRVWTYDAVQRPIRTAHFSLDTVKGTISFVPNGTRVVDGHHRLKSVKP